MSDITQETAPIEEKKNIAAGFWRRTLAFWVDIAVLGIVGSAVITIFYTTLLRIGEWSRLIGFAIGSLYFVFLEGYAGNNQSIGKRVMCIKVVRCVDGEISSLSLSQAWLRYAVIAIPMVLGGISFIDLPSLHSPELAWLQTANSSIVFCWAIAILYLLIFNLPSRRTLSDIWTSSMVVRVDAPEPTRVEAVKRGHWVAVGSLLAVLFASSIAVNRWMLPQLVPELSALQQIVSATPGVAAVNINMNTTTKLGTSEKYTTRTIAVSFADPQGVNEARLTQIAKAAFANFPQLSKQDHIVLVGMTAVNLGIASWSNRYMLNFSPSEWATRIAGAPSSKN